MANTFNYMILRFVPYPDAGEFVNVGVFLVCKALGWMNFKIDYDKARRKTKSLFPQFDMKVFKEGILYMENGLKYQLKQNCPEDTLALYSRFGEGQFQFSKTSGVITEKHPDELLGELYDRLVAGMRTDGKESQDERMRRQIRSLISPYPWGKLYKKEDFCTPQGYKISLPFVAKGQKAAKPFALQADSYKELMDNTILWKARFEMMSSLFPPKVILAYSLPVEDNQRQLATEFIDELNGSRISCLDMQGDPNQIINAMSLPA